VQGLHDLVPAWTQHTLAHARRAYMIWCRPGLSTPLLVRAGLTWSGAGLDSAHSCSCAQGLHDLVPAWTQHTLAHARRAYMIWCWPGLSTPLLVRAGLAWSGAILDSAHSCSCAQGLHDLVKAWTQHNLAHARRAYMICTKSLHRTLQRCSSSTDTVKVTGDLSGGTVVEKSEGATVETADAPRWVMEVGVAGFHGRWCRVRTYLKEGRVTRWQILEYYSA